MVGTLLASARLVTLARRAPRRNRGATRSVVLALAAAMGVVNGVHDSTADGRTDAAQAVTTGLTNADVSVLSVADLTDGSTAGEKHATHLAGGHTQDGILTLLAHQLDAGACGTSQSSALARLQLDCVNQGTNRDGGQWHSVTGLDVSLNAGLNDVANLQTTRVKDVALLAVYIVQKSDACAAVRIVFNGGNLCWYAILVTLEVDLTVTTLVTATLMTSGEATVVVAASLLRQWLQQRLLRLGRSDLGEVRNHLETTSRGSWIVLLYSHFKPFF